MSLIRRCQVNTLVYWPRIDTLPTGEPVWGAPQEMTCRWDDRVREIIGPHGTKVLSRVEIISQSRLEVGGLVRKGTLADTAYWDDPKQAAGVYEILESSETPNLRGTESLFEVWA